MSPRLGDRLVTVGAVIFGLGVLAILAAFLPFLVTGHKSYAEPLLFAVDAAPAGLAIALIGLVVGARRPQR